MCIILHGCTRYQKSHWFLGGRKRGSSSNHPPVRRAGPVVIGLICVMVQTCGTGPRLQQKGKGCGQRFVCWLSGGWSGRWRQPVPLFPTPRCPQIERKTDIAHRYANTQAVTHMQKHCVHFLFRFFVEKKVFCGLVFLCSIAGLRREFTVFLSFKYGNAGCSQTGSRSAIDRDSWRQVL